jgi:hypothetical protein
MTVRVPSQRLASRLVGVVAAVALLAAGVTDGWVLAWFGYGVVGALILWHRPGNRIGFLCVAVAGGMAVSAWGQRVAGSAPGTGPVLLEQVAFVAGAFAYLSLASIVAVFPSGRAPSRLSRLVWLACCTLAIVLPIAVLVDPRPLGGTGRVSPWAIAGVADVARLVLDQGFLLVPILMLLGLISLVPRWRASSGIERQQYRWFLVGITLAAVTLAAGFGATGGLYLALLVVGINAVPVALAVAVTRYGLYELDRVISRSASYAIVTGLLVAAYAVVVTSASRLLGETSTLAVALATLAAAALFQPLLRRVQRLVDRRFNRQRVNHEKAVDDFAARLRDQLEEADTSADLVRVTTATLEPASARLWLRGPTR